MDDLKAHWIREVKITVLPDDVEAVTAPTSQEDDSFDASVFPNGEAAMQPTVGTALSEPPSLDFSADLSFDDYVFDLENFR